VADGKELRDFDGETYLMERALIADVSLVKAWRADQSGNREVSPHGAQLIPTVAMAGKVCIVEVEVVETERHGADQVHLPGIYVHASCAIEPGKNT
jgi:3-oxoacid CoA-transferase subunit A